MQKYPMVETRTVVGIYRDRIVPLGFLGGAGSSIHSTAKRLSSKGCFYFMAGYEILKAKTVCLNAPDVCQLEVAPPISLKRQDHDSFMIMP